MKNVVFGVKSTKERILDSALDLFSEKGYDGVGVDLIAANCGLKGPSIYKHFKGKEEILDILIERIELYYEENFGTQQFPGKIPDTMQELVESSLKRIEFTMHDELIKKTRRILSMEQFRNKKIARIASFHNFESIHGLYKKIFEQMIKNKVIKQVDAEFLSMSFIMPVSIFIQICDREPDREEELMKKIKQYFIEFSQEYGLK